MSKSQSNNSRTQIPLTAIRSHPVTPNLADEYPNADFTAGDHPVQERYTRKGTVLVCRRCGRWAELTNATEFQAACNPDASHPKHYSVRLKLQQKE